MSTSRGVGRPIPLGKQQPGLPLTHRLKEVWQRHNDTPDLDVVHDWGHPVAHAQNRKWCGLTLDPTAVGDPAAPKSLHKKNSLKWFTTR